jgi:hypothetical protein
MRPIRAKCFYRESDDLKGCSVSFVDFVSTQSVLQNQTQSPAKVPQIKLAIQKGQNLEPKYSFNQWWLAA